MLLANPPYPQPPPPPPANLRGQPSSSTQCTEERTLPAYQRPRSEESTVFVRSKLHSIYFAPFTNSTSILAYHPFFYDSFSLSIELIILKAMNGSLLDLWSPGNQYPVKFHSATQKGVLLTLTIEGDVSADAVSFLRRLYAGHRRVLSK